MDSVFSVSEEDAGTRVDVFLAHHSGLSRSRVKKLIDEGCIVFHDGSPLKPSYHIEKDDVIKLNLSPIKKPEFLPENIPLDIVFQDKYIVVVNKPPGMVVHPGRGNVTGTLAAALLYQITGKERYRKLAIDIGDFLASCQGDDGSWSIPEGYPDDLDTYLRQDIANEFIIWLKDIDLAVRGS